MRKSVVLGKIWTVLYKETDLEQEGLKILAEEILEKIEEDMEPKQHWVKDGDNGSHWESGWEDEEDYSDPRTN